MDWSATEIGGAVISIVWSWWAARLVFQMLGGEDVPKVPDEITVIVKHEYPANADD